LEWSTGDVCLSGTAEIFDAGLVGEAAALRTRWSRASGPVAASDRASRESRGYLHEP